MAGIEVTENELAEILGKKGQESRWVTAIAGPPAAGKSTLVTKVAQVLNDADPGSAAILPMDGFHYDNAILDARGWRPRKGAPHTFDVAGFGHMLGRLRRNDETEVAAPVFDRKLELGRNCAQIIPQSVRHLLVEGNYLLLDQAPWSDLAPLFDTTVFIEVPIDVLRDRLVQRWRNYPEDEALRKMNENDLPNGRKVVEHSRGADYILNYSG
mgnify:CR=1 FL=1